MKPIISRTVWILSLVSLMTDTASEMLYPVMPVFLKSIGFSVLLIGILEGVAEATAGLSKGYFGNLSDVTSRRVIFVRAGYALSAITKPLMAVFTAPLWIFLCRTTDRIGKGLRTAPRDAILSDEATAETKARVFGFHRSMDTIGAFLGPAAALVFLYFYPEEYQLLFLVAFIPGVLATAFTFLLRERSKPAAVANKVAFFSFLAYWKRASHSYKTIVIGLLFFTLINSSDVFLLLRAKESGLTDVQTIGVYIFYNFIYAMAAYPAGMLADKIGLRNTLIGGLILFACVYAGFSQTGTIWWYGTLFLIYGIYAACTESIGKAWITNHCNKEETATVIGFYTSFQSVFTFIASTMAGFIWYHWSGTALFIATGILSLLAASYFVLATRE